jgi:hypothetical protein
VVVTVSTPRRVVFLFDFFPLPIALAVDVMYGQWLPAHLPQLSSSNLLDNSTEPHLKALLSLTESIPRATEMLIEVLREVFTANTFVTFNKTTPTQVLQRLFITMEKRYSGADFAAIMLDNAALVFSIFWKTKVPWNGNVNRVMIDGYLVNPPETVSMQFITAMTALSLWRLKMYLIDDMTLLTPVVEATAKPITSLKTSVGRWSRWGTPL